MKVQFRQGQEIVFCDKPYGLSTHANETGGQGFVEWMSEHLGQKLWVVHRLDKTTTGSLAFATSAKRAEELRQAFEQHQVKKKYWFLTDRSSSEITYERESLIEKHGNQFVSEDSKTPNAKTRFQRVKRSPFFELWQAEPFSGKPHQVRLHAADIGLPILGDTLYGGASFPHLCLHSLSLQIPGEEVWTTPAPRFFERLGILKDQKLIQILSSLDRRQRLFGFLKNPEQTMRLVHSEIPEYRLDLLGEIMWLNWYQEAAPTERDLERWDFIRGIVGRPLVIQKRQDRGADPNTQNLWFLPSSKMSELPEKWTALEGDLKFQFRREQGLSAGLFLDQRLNREKVRAMAAGKKVLNLFAYTGGFSLAAARGGAESVTTVDLSKNFLNWSQENFRLNDLDPAKFEWSAADSFIYLGGAKKRDRKWDLIVCDPPSFSRSGKTVFKLKDDLETLLTACRDCLSPKGTLLFSCNLESMSEDELLERIQDLFPRASVVRGDQDLDFELPGVDRSLKSFWISF